MRKVIKTIDVNAHITNIKCDIYTHIDGARAYISFDNLGEGVIKSVSFFAKAYDGKSAPVFVNGKEIFNITITDIAVEENASLNEFEIKLNDNSIKKIELWENTLTFSDDRVLTYEGKREEKFCLEEFTYSTEEGEELHALRTMYDQRVQYNVLETEFGWICTCGRLNKSGSDSCSLCGHKKEETKAALSPEGRKALVLKKAEMDLKRDEENLTKYYKSEKAAKVKRVAIPLFVVLCIAGVVFGGWKLFLQGRVRFDSKEALQNAVEGTYTCYDEEEIPMKQLSVSEGEVLFKWVGEEEVEEEAHDITAWNYKIGQFHANHDIIVTPEGDLKDGSLLYEKGGEELQMPTEVETEVEE